MANVATQIIWPTDSTILVRVVVLNVGQGDSAIVLVAEGESYRTLLVDINMHSKLGIDVPKLVADLVGKNGLDVFINTHPHNDHLCGVTELSDAVDIREVWHSGHVPGKEDRDAYDNLQKVIKKTKKSYGDSAEVLLLASKSPVAIGEAEYYILSPAKYVVDSVSGETEGGRRKRIHEQCAVLKFGLPRRWIMLTGDADRDAWELHIAKYHKDRIQADVLAAAHHGSRSFFKHEEEEEPYLDALQGIAPTHVILSAPKSNESRHEHPHPDAVELYEDEVGAEGMHHTGKDRHSFICDIFRDGSFEVTPDDGKLFEAYPYAADDPDDGETKSVSLQNSRPRTPPAQPFA